VFKEVIADDDFGRLVRTDSDGAGAGGLDGNLADEVFLLGQGRGRLGGGGSILVCD